jgi:hypothetical protein
MIDIDALAVKLKAGVINAFSLTFAIEASKLPA